MDNMTGIRPRVLEITGYGAPSNDSEVRALKLTWFRKQFLMDPLTDVQTQQHARAYILYMIETTLFSNYSTNMTYLKWWPLLEDFDACGVMSWGSVVLAFLYRELYKVSLMRTSQFRNIVHFCK